MIKNMFRRFMALVITALMIISMIPATAIPVFAATKTVDGIPASAGISVTYSDTGSCSVSDTDPLSLSCSVKGKGKCGSGGYSQTNTIVLTNTSGYPMNIKFSYSGTIEDGGSVNVNGAEKKGTDRKDTTVNDEASKKLANNGTITVTLVSAADENSTTSLTLSNIRLEELPPVDVTFKAPANGSYTVNGTTITTDTVIAARSYAVVASPAQNCKFIGWVNAANNELLSTSASTTLTFLEATTIKPVFTSANNEAYFLAGGTKLYSDLNEACAYALSVSNKTVVPVNNGTLLSGNYTIPSGVTLLIPFDAANTIYTTSPALVNGGAATNNNNAYRTMRMANGASITVNGAISISAKQGTNTACVHGPYGKIQMDDNSSISVENGGALYAWGYITGSGTVDIKSGAKVYEAFQITSWRGGNCTNSMNGNSSRVFPITQYYVQNIEVPMTLHAGAKEYAYASVSVTLAGDIGTAVQFVGTDSSMFVISNGSVTKRYDGARDRQVIEVNGDVSLSPMTIDLYVKLRTQDYELPVTNNMVIDVKSGTTTVKQNIAVLPGAEVIVREGAKCVLGEGVSVFAYDRDEWDTSKKEPKIRGYAGNAENTNFIPLAFAPGRSYTRTDAKDITDAYVQIDGVMDASAGYLYSTLGGANVTSTGSGQIITKEGTQKETYQVIQSGNTPDSYPAITITPLKLKNADNTYVQSATNTYTYSNGKWVCATHTPTGDGVVTAPTCTAGGYTTHTCSVCGTNYKVDETDALGHTEGTIPGKDATCTETGLTEGKKCSVCNEVLVAQTVVDALGHTEGDVVVENNVDPTCTDGGSYDNVVYCTVCKAEVSREKKTVAALGHTPAAAVEENIVDATCTDAGSHDNVVKCSVCGEELSREHVNSAALGHEEQTIPGYAATCTEAGQTDGKSCTRCGETTVPQEIIPALGHTPVTDAAKAPTCTETGLTEGSHCDVCNIVLVEQEEVPALGHTPVTDAAKAPTCTETGLTEGSHCDVCKTVLVKQETVDALGHSWDEGVETTAPGCTSVGVKTYTCRTCGGTKTEAISATGHTPVTDEAKEPTCTETGLKEGSHCDVCKIVLVEQEIIPALTHDYISVVTAPTCETKGYTTYTCQRDGCGHSYTGNEVDALGHDYVGVVTAPTCTAKGYTTYTCKNDLNHTYTADEVDELGHDYVAEVTDPTCTAQGYTTHTCSRCDDSYVDSYVDALGHSAAEAVIENNVDPTCTVDGKYDSVVYCSVCGTELSRETITVSAVGHTVVTDAAVPPTCEGTGLTEGTHCDVCGEVLIKQQTVDALGHNYASVVTDPTCTEQGYTTHTCSRCDDSYVDSYVTALGHNIVVDAAVAPGCESTGLTEGSHCTRCNDATVAQTVVPATGHSYNAVVTAPTCEEDGYTTHTCAGCGDTYTDSVTEATGHDYDDGVVTTDPTCTVPGVKTFTCQNDSNHTYTEAVDVIDHTPGDAKQENYVPATCGEPGSYDSVVYCSMCGKHEFSRTSVVVPATGEHSWDDGEITTEPTCSAEGVKTFTCSVCGGTKTEAVAIDADAHEWDEGVVTTDPTCTTDGVKTYTCKHDASHTYTEPVEKLGHIDEEPAGERDYYCDRCGAEMCEKHNEQTIPAVAPTCEKDGLTEGKVCTICGHTLLEQKVDPAIGHKWDAGVITTPATCTEDGVKTYTCQNDTSHTYTETVKATGHDYSSVVTAPTCTDAGYTTHTCASCGDSYVDSYVDALGHTEVVDKGYEWTCTKDGLSDGKHCTVCGKVTVAQNVMPTPGHSLNYVEAKEATCTEPGWKAYETCGVCDYTTFEQITVDHSFKVEVAGTRTDATCMAEGSVTMKCETCEATEDQTLEINAAAHEWGEVKYTWAEDHSSCTAERVCALNAEHIDTATAEGEAVSSEETKASTCTEPGKTTYTANFGEGHWAGTASEEVDVEALGHDYVEGVCSRCGEAENGECEHEWGDDLVCDVCGLFKFYGANVTLANSLDMAFYFPRNVVANWDGYYVEAIRTYSSYEGSTKSDQIKTYDSDDWSVNGGYFVVMYTEFAAKEMCDTIALTVYDPNGKAVSITYTDSIKNYAGRALASAEKRNEPLLMTCIVDMLNYGAAAQTYFKYGLEEGVYANSDLSETQKAYASEKLSTVRDTLTDKNSSRWRGSTLYLKSNISFETLVRNATEDMVAEISYTGYKGNVVKKTVKIAWSDNNSYLRFCVPDLVVGDARCPITFKFYSDSSKRTLIAEAKDSIEAYVSRSTSGKEVAETFMIFADSARIYLSSRNG